MAEPAERTPPLRRAPKAQRRIRRAYAELLGVVLAAISALSALLIWHLARRGRIVRDRLGTPRNVQWPDLDDQDQTAEETPRP